MSDIEEKMIFDELNKLYPDKVIKNLSKNTVLYQHISNIASEKKMSTKEYLHNNNYIYGQDASIQKLEKEIEIELKKIGSKTINSSDITKTTLYSSIFRVSKEYGCSVQEYIESLDYVYIKNTSNKREIDYTSIKCLIEKFGFSYLEIGDMLHVSKQRVLQILKEDRESKISWRSNRTEDYAVLYEMILNHQFECVINEVRYIFRNNMNGDVCFIWYDDEICQCAFNEDFPEYIIEIIREKRMDYFCPEDIELLENAEIVNIMKKAQIFLNKEKMEIAKKGASKHNIDDITDYSKFLGFFGYVTEKEKNTDKKIIEFLENNLIDDEVYISSDSKNQWIRSYANRCGMTLDKFVEFFGYKKAKRNKYIELDEYYEGQIEEFRTKFQKIAVEGNKIRIEGNLYQTVHRFCKINSINIDDFVADLGYTRIKGKRVTDLDTRSDAIKRYQLQELKQSIDLTLEYNNKFYMDAKTLELKRKRNKNLVHQLKEIYGCKCQLCSNNLWMPIHKEDGSYYCEVHHIMGLAEENEEENLDVLENLIVVCPNHHKMLHYHNGGYKKITRKNNTLYFYNNSDEEIQIMDNYHLKEM